MRTIQEASAIAPADKELLRAVKGVIQGFLPSATVLLYGSVARGTQEPESDYDILVLAEHSVTPLMERTVRGAVYDLQLEHEILVTTTFFDRHDWDRHQAMPFHREVDRDGVLL